MRLFEVYNKESSTYPLVISLPHSGQAIPEQVRRRMLPKVVLPNMDWFLPELYAFFIPMGVTVLKNNISRYVADPNRNPEITGNGKYSQTIVYQKTTWNRPMYETPLRLREIAERIQNYYLPYHKALKELLEQKLERFGKAYLLDLHSFASFSDDVEENIVLSNNCFQTSSKGYFYLIKQQLQQSGFSVSENRPFKGGYITKYYGTVFGEKVESVQLELRYHQYIDDRYFGEEELCEWKEPVFASARERLSRAFQEILSGLEF